jgi:hypothetical protein
VQTITTSKFGSGYINRDNQADHHVKIRKRGHHTRGWGRDCDAHGFRGRLYHSRLHDEAGEGSGTKQRHHPVGAEVIFSGEGTCDLGTTSQ